MERSYLEIIFLCGLVSQIIFHLYYVMNDLSNIGGYFRNRREQVFLVLAGIGFLLLPLVYVFSTWFSILDYNLPKWLGFFSTIFYCFGIWLFYMAYTEMGTQWSPGYNIREQQVLICSGVFNRVRHPMYSALVIMAVSQVLMLQNWIVGPAFLLLSVPFFAYRIRREELQLVRNFGDEYRSYMSRTNSLVPKMEQIDFRIIMDRIKSLIPKKRV